MYLKDILWRFALKYLVNPNKIVDVEGNKMHLDSKDSLLLSIKKYESKNIALMKSIVKKGDYVIDIGANIGYFSVILANLVGQDGKVFAFEPDPTNFEILKKNVKLNNHKNVECINKAVSNKNSKVKLFLSDMNNGDHRCYNPKDKNHCSHIECNAVKLDNFLKRKPINFVKLDVQGFEYYALIGMKKILDEPNLKLIMEFWPKGINESGYTTKDIIDLLSSKGFKLFDIEKSLEIPVDYNTLIEKYGNSDRFTSLFCCKVQPKNLSLPGRGS